MESMDTLQELAEFLEEQHIGFAAASDREYLRAIKKVLAEEKSEPSSEMIRYFVSRVYSGTQTQQIIDRFAPLVREAFRQFVNDQLVACIQRVINGQDHGGALDHPPYDTNSTDEEFEGFFVVNVT